MQECKILGIQQIFTSYNNERGNANIERYLRTYKEEVVWSVEEMSYSELIDFQRYIIFDHLKRLM